jgi:aryl-alcohol dehydrogenase-like predicted oxidoreductase
VSTAALALAWVLQHPDCTAAVIGPSRTPPALAHVAEAMTLSLSPDEHDQLADPFRSRAARPRRD